MGGNRAIGFDGALERPGPGDEAHQRDNPQ
jgi:hypothetical protein